MDTNSEEFRKRIHHCMAEYLGYFSIPVAELFEPGTPEFADLLFVNNGHEVWGDERFEGAALNSLDRIGESVRKVVQKNMDAYITDLRHSLAGILMRDKKKPRKPKSRRGRSKAKN